MPSPETSSTALALGLALSAGLVAGLASFAVGEAAPKAVTPLLKVPPGVRGSDVPIALEAQRRGAKDRVAAVSYGALGGFLGLALGLAGGLSGRSIPRGATAGLVGAVLGASAGAGISAFGLPYYHAARAATPDDAITNDLGPALVTHAAIWLPIGLAAGLAHGLGLGGGRAGGAAVGGLLGAALGTIVHEVGGAVGFPLSESFRPVAVAWPPRLLAHLGVALGVALGACWAARGLTLRRSRAA